jgi:hypothetical protein
MSTTEASQSKSLTARQREWLSHVEAWGEQGETLKACALNHQDVPYDPGRMPHRGLERAAPGHATSCANSRAARVWSCPP